MYRKVTLKNNLRIVTHPMKDRESVAIGIWLGVGGRYENDQNKGAAHFLEHILFKGSRKYSCNQIKEKIEGVGGAFNAFTDEEYTCYYAKVPARHFASTFDIFADMVRFPRIHSADVAKEKTVILEEIKMYHDLPQYLVMELLEGLLWPEHPLGKNLAGTFESVQKMSAGDLKKFHAAYYCPNNAVVALAGNIQEQNIQMIEQRFAGFPQSKARSFSAAPDRQTQARMNFFNKETEQMHLALGLTTFSIIHPDRYTLALLNIILGANMSSRLFNEVREKRGLAYAISSGMKLLQDTGMLVIRAGVDNKKIEEAFALILRELRKIVKTPVTADELKRAKEYYLGQVSLSLEDALDHMFWIGEAVISQDKTRTLKEVRAAVSQVSQADVQRVAGQILQPQAMSLAVVGSLSSSQKKSLRNLILN